MVSYKISRSNILRVPSFINVQLRCSVLNKVFLVNHWRNILNCRCKWLCSVILIMHRLKNISFASLECAILNDIRNITNVLEISNLPTLQFFVGGARRSVRPPTITGKYLTLPILHNCTTRGMCQCRFQKVIV